MRKGIIYVYFNRTKYEKEGIEKYYVGQTVGTMEQRAGKDGRRYGWDDLNYNSKFANGIRKWGWDAFEGRVLEEVYEEDLNELEKFYIEQFDSFKNGYNSTIGGEGVRGFNHNEETIKKISKKCSVANKKRWEDQEYREKQSEGIKKHYKDPKARKRQSKAIKTSWKNPERKKIQSEKLSGEKNYKAKSVYCNELNILFPCIKIAEKYCKNVLNSKIGPISGVCDGNRNFTGRLADGTKLTWNWLEDVDQETLDKAEFIDSKKYEEILSQNVNVCK